MYRLVLCVMLLSGCGNENCQQEFYAAGINFCLDYVPDYPVSTSLIEDVVQVIERETNQYYPSVVDVAGMFAQRSVFVYVVSGDLYYDCIDTELDRVKICKGVGGVNGDGGHYIIIERPKYRNACFSKGVLMHELLHSVDKFYLNGDYHSTPHMFKENYTDYDDINSTIESHAILSLKDVSLNYPDNCSRYSD